MSKSRTSQSSREFAAGHVLVEEFEFNLPNESTSENSVTSYVSYYCGYPASMKMAWIEKNPGRRFLGCYNYKTTKCGYFGWVDKEMKPCERVYNFYLKIQKHRKETEKMKNTVVLQEMKIEALQKLNNKLQNGLKMELKMKGLSIKKKCIWGIVLFVIYVFFGKVLY